MKSSTSERWQAAKTLRHCNTAPSPCADTRRLPAALWPHQLIRSPHPGLRKQARLDISLIVSSALLLLAATARGADDDYAHSAERLIAEVSKRFGIDVVRSEGSFEVPNRRGGVVTGKPANAIDTQRFLPQFTRELSLYPKDFVKRSGLKRIVLCAELRYSDLECGGFASPGPPPAMYLDVSLENERYRCLTIHHEFYHIIDYADDGELGDDEVWSSFNPQGFKYSHQLGDDEGIDVVPTTKLRGFLTPHSRTDVAEDKAEVFAHLVVNGSFVMNHAQRDPFLRAKVIATKRKVRIFCPEVDEKFWDAACHLKRPGPDPMDM